MALRARIQPWLRAVAVGHGLTRTMIGTGLLVSPAAGRAWLGDDVRRGGGRVALDAMGIREVVIGVGQLHALRSGAPVRPWFALGTALEVVDAVSTIRQRDRLPDSFVPDAISGLALSGIAGGALVALLLEE